MFLQFYGMEEQPFGVTPDARFIHFSHTHREALSSLYCGIRDRRGFLALIAPPGTGKTTLLFHLLDRLRASARTVFLFDAPPDPENLMLCVASDLGIDTAGGTVFKIRQEFHALLTREHQAGRDVVIVADEAQSLSSPVLEKLRMLSNFECRTDKLLQVVLAGQPALAPRLSAPDLLQLRQRLSIVATIQPLNHDEVFDYIRHRLRLAGCSAEVFTRDALLLIADASKGIPRTINVLCYNSLALGCAHKRKVIDSHIISEVTSDLALEIPNFEAKNVISVASIFPDADLRSSDNNDHADKEKRERDMESFAAEVIPTGLPAMMKVSIGLALLLIIIPVTVLSRPRRTRSSGLNTSLQSLWLRGSNHTVPTIREPDQPRAIILRRLTSMPSNVTRVHYWSQSGITTVAVDTQEQVRYEVHRLSAPDRIYVDLFNNRLQPRLIGKRLQVADAVVKKIRFAQHPGPVTRVTIETYGVCEFRVAEKANPTVVMIEVKHRAHAADQRSSVSAASNRPS